MQRTFYALGTFIAIIYILFVGQFILKPLVLAVFIAISVNPMVEGLSKRIRSHFLSFIIVFLSVSGLISFVAYLVGGQVFSLFQDLQGDQFKSDNIQSGISEVLTGYGFNYRDVSEAISNFISIIFDNLGTILASVLSASGSGILMLLLTIVLSYFLSAYYPGVKAQMLTITPDKYSTEIKTSLRETPKVVRSYLKGMSIVMVILSILTFLAYWLIGVEYALVWGILTGILAFIPYVGSTIAMVLPFSYSMVSQGDFKQAFLILIAFGIIQQIEGNFLTPKIVGDNVNMNPMAIIIVMLLAAQLWGIIGVFICIPLAAICYKVLSLFPSTAPVARLLSSNLRAK